MDRRAFLIETGGTALGLAGAGGARRLWAAPPADRASAAKLAEACEKAKRLGIGRAVLDGPLSAEVDSYGTWTLVYTAGKAGLQPGGGIRIALRHLVPSWTNIQNAKPNEDGFVRVRAANGVAVKVVVECTNWSKRFFNDYFPLQNIVEVIVGGPGLKPGQSIRVTYGDTTGGSKGMRLQPFDEERFLFMTYVDAPGRGEYLPLVDSPTLRILAGEPVRLAAVAPSHAVAGRASNCIVRAEDRFGNPASGYRGTVRLAATGGRAVLPQPHTFSPDDRGVHRFDGIVFAAPAVHRLNASEGRLETRSNPVLVAARPGGRRCLWGDLHGHTVFSDGRGSVAEYYLFARHVSALDFCAVSDHAFEITEAMWRDSKAATNAANDPGNFTTFHAYEWSGVSAVGGDHNVYWRDEDPPIFRSTSYYSPRNTQMVHDGRTKIPHVRELFAALRKHLRDKNVLCIPHRGGRAGNPKWHDPKIQRLVECYCEHFRSQEWAQGFLRRGLRLGLMGSSDDHYGNPGYGFLKPARRKLVGEGLVAVWAEENTRRCVFDALYDRHCYATTGDRIVLDFRVDGHLMGSEIRATPAPKLTVEVAGTDTIDRVEILKNGRGAHTEAPGKHVAHVQWTDPNVTSGQSCWYHVHVVQRNGEEALCSPVWVNPMGGG